MSVSNQSERVWFITGASRGFGALIAGEALAAGDAVVASARDPRAVTAALGVNPNLLAVALDVTQAGQVKEAVRSAVQRFGRIDVLVNNAGYGLLGGIEEASAAEVERVYAANVFGLLSVTRTVLPHMRQRRSGRIINLSSVGGYSASPGWGIYCSTKFAVEGLTEALAAEVAPLGIFATVVEPGYFRTDFLDERSLARSQQQIADYADTVGGMREMARHRNHQQPGDPAKLAKAIVTLVNAKQPPLRLALGSDTLHSIERKNRAVAENLAAWRELSVSTDYSS